MCGVVAEQTPDQDSVRLETGVEVHVITTDNDSQLLDGQVQIVIRSVFVEVQTGGRVVCDALLGDSY